MKNICIEIEGPEYIELVSLDKASENKFNLTTICDLQSCAVIKLFLFQKNKGVRLKEEEKLLLHKIELKNIPPDVAGMPDIYLSGNFDGEKTLYLEVEINGKIYNKKSINLYKFLDNKKKKARILISMAIILTIPFIFFTIFIIRNTLLKVKESSGSIKSYETVTTPKSIPGDDRSLLKTDKTYDLNEVNKLDKLNKIDESYKNSKKNKITQKQKESIRTQAQAVFEKSVVYFKPDSAVLTKETKIKLDNILDVFKQKPDIGIKISGHCSVYLTEEFRAKLSNSRAERVYSYLRENGWNPVVSPVVIGYGSEYPITRDLNLQNLNRRVEIECKNPVKE